MVGSLVSNPQEIYAKLKEYKMRLLDSNEAGDEGLYVLSCALEALVGVDERLL